jgi:uncharacterized protein (UPF0276 family)
VIHNSSSEIPVGFGVGLRAPHFTYVLNNRPRLDWLEATTENYIGTQTGSGGFPLDMLRKIRSHYPIALHGVSLNIGSSDPLDQAYLARVKKLFQQIEPQWISDHFCWTGVQGQNLHDLLPLPYTQNLADHLVSRLQEVQETFGRRILLENVSTYFQYRLSEMSEVEFMNDVTRRSGCGLLLDMNNVYVSAHNHGFDPVQYIDEVRKDSVGYFHLAGHSVEGNLLIDTHDHPVSGPVWALYKRAVERFGKVPTLLEWDDQIPEFPVLEAELRKASQIQKDIYDNTVSRINPPANRTETRLD